MCACMQAGEAGVWMDTNTDDDEDESKYGHFKTHLTSIAKINTDPTKWVCSRHRACWGSRAWGGPMC